MLLTLFVSVWVSLEQGTLQIMDMEIVYAWGLVWHNQNQKRWDCRSKNLVSISLGLILIFYMPKHI